MNKPSVSAGVVAGVALGAAALGAAAVAVRAACLQVARTRNGLARVKRVHDEGGDEVRVLVQGGVYQSASYVGERWAEPVFAYYRAFDDVFEAEDAMRDAYGHGIDRMLMLGGGGFAYPKFALMSHAGLRMDVIEYDGEITRLARRWFYLDELERAVGDRLRVITAEARSYLGVTSVGHRRYDVVVSDCFGGAEPVRKLATVEALRLVRGSLNPGGIYVANIVSANEGSDVRSCAIALPRHSRYSPTPGWSHVAMRSSAARRTTCSSPATATTPLPKPCPSTPTSSAPFFTTNRSPRPKKTGLRRGRASRERAASCLRCRARLRQSLCARAPRERTRRSDQNKAPRRDRRARWD